MEKAKKLKITIDASCLIINPISGLSEVVQNLLLHMPLVNSNVQLSLFLNYFRAPFGKRDISFPRTANLICRIPRRLTSLWWQLGFPPVDFYLGSSKVFHSLHIQVPPTQKIKSVLTVHDCRYLALPELYKRQEVREYKKKMLSSLGRAEKVVTVSDFTRHELINHFSLPKERIKTIHNGFKKPVIQTEDWEDKIDLFLDKGNIPQTYLLYVGVLDPRKNLIRLIEALALCRKELGDFPNLIISGVSSKDWTQSNQAKRATELGLMENIHVTGKLKKETLMCLMRKAHALCYPSLYEGFGFPPLEAMSFGVPVLAGNSAAIPEIVGKAACLVDPYSIEDLSKGLIRIVMDTDYRQALVRSGYERIKKFSWKKAAQEYVCIYKEVAC